MYKLVFFPDPNLFIRTQHVTQFDEELALLLDSMTKIMRDNKGLGLSANQVGSRQRCFVMLDKKTDMVVEFINPVVVEESGHTLIDEACLSAPGVTIQRSRPKEVTIEARNRTGEEITVILSDIEAVCVMHELDHLNGELFLDGAPRNQRRAAKRKLGLE